MAGTRGGVASAMPTPYNVLAREVLSLWVFAASK
jgi:hypothetical protein